MMKAMTLKLANENAFKKENKNNFYIGDKCYRYEDTVKTTKTCSEGIMSVDLVVAFDYKNSRYTVFDLSKKCTANKKVVVSI